MLNQLLPKLDATAAALGTLAPVDGRELLTRNTDVQGWGRRTVGDLKGMCWHQALSWGTVEDVARYHTGPQSHLRQGGVESISYTFAIRRNGEIVLCNDLGQRVWSQGYRGRDGDENAEFLSVLFEGFFLGPDVTEPSAGEPTDEQILSGLTLWRTCRELWAWDAGALYGHYHFGKPACPGYTLQGLIDAVRSNAPARAIDLSTTAGRQRALKQLGFYTGRLDGDWGPVSKGALVTFQTAQDLVPDGVWGSKTEAAIRSALLDEGRVT
ncbi:MAG TPA: peptidoglycan-binding domain-containing protein [Longimicrobiales bacterium]|nr:peptidoglycan-binding domain-containing protein [Longimicrobiales bacterium]